MAIPAARPGLPVGLGVAHATNDPGELLDEVACSPGLIRLECEWSTGNGLQGAEVAGDRRGVVCVGDQADVSIWAHQDQGVLAVCVGRVPAVVDEAAWPDQVGLDDLRFELGECCGAAFTKAEQGEMGSAEEIEQAFRRAGERVAAGGVWRPVARLRSVDRLAALTDSRLHRYPSWSWVSSGEATASTPPPESLIAARTALSRSEVMLSSQLAIGSRSSS